MNLKKGFKKVLRKIKRNFVRFLEGILIAIVPVFHRLLEKKLKGKTTVNVLFLVVHGSVWKFDRLYRLLAADIRYNPVVAVCPYIAFGDKAMRREMALAESEMRKKGYRVLSTWDEAKAGWIDLKKRVRPDLVFFTNPHNLTRKEYLITNFLDRLTCYCQYSFHVTHLNRLQYDQLFHNVLWKAFYETNMHLELARAHARNRAKNVIVTGFPGIDNLVDLAYIKKTVWKRNDVKKIIWAPHHTINDAKTHLGFSTFMVYSEAFLKIAEAYEDRIQFAFKPHPILRAKLSDPKVWGMEKTNDYYNRWVTLKNGQLEEGDYEDLFINSDAMLLDSASFMTEYLVTGKPSLFLVSDEGLTNRFNAFGISVYNCLYHAFNLTEIRNFIDNVVLGSIDTMKDRRLAFVESKILSAYNGSASAMIKKNLDQYL